MRAHPYMTRRKGSQNLYYKRPVPAELQIADRPKQIWRSLGESDPKKVKVAYRTVDAEVDALFDLWRIEAASSVAAGAETNQADPIRGQGPSGPARTLTPALLRQIADVHYQNVFENDFALRSCLWAKAEKDEAAFWRGDIIKFPKSYWGGASGLKRSFEHYLEESPSLEGVFLYAMFAHRNERLNELQRDYRVGATHRHNETADALLTRFGLTPTEGERVRLIRKLIEVEIDALNDLRLGDEANFNQILERETAAQPTTIEPKRVKPSQKASELIEKYLEATARERDWPKKTTLRKRGELREFVEIVGDRPVNDYDHGAGVLFKEIQLSLPRSRQIAPFKALTILRAAQKASELRKAGHQVDLLDPRTIKDKLGTVSLFFKWARSRDPSVTNPVAEQKVHLTRKRAQRKKRQPWSIDELNLLFAAPIYTGCRSETHWKQPGTIQLRESAIFWVPLIALFSGMRLGEIMQLRVSDLKTKEGLQYFDVTPLIADASTDAEDDEADEKSLKTATSRRSIPIHQTLLDIGFGVFLETRRNNGDVRLFPEYSKAADDGSWSKQFSKHFKRFRESIGVTRAGVKFHSLRHNVEDALRNANVRQEFRDAIQGHGENGVSREYGTGYYVSTLNEALQQIRYEGLKLEHLFV